MKILGVGHDLWISSATMIDSGRIVGAIAEERLNRQKGFQGFPLKSINEILHITNSSIEDIDLVCVGWNPAQYFNTLHPRFSKTPRWRAEMLYAIPNYIQSMRSDVLDPQYTEIQIDGIRSRIIYFDHHKCHSYCSHQLSGFNESLNISIDGRGERKTSSINIISKSQYAELGFSLFPSSLGLFYGSFTQFFGFKPHSDEWKFMAISAMGSRDKYYFKFKGILDEIITIDNLSIKQDMKYFGYDQPDVYGKSWIQPDLQNRLELSPLLSWSNTHHNIQVYYSLALAVQDTFEELLYELVDKSSKYTGIKNITITGGCAMNSLCNGKLNSKFPGKSFYIPPCPDDSGISLGAAILGSIHSQQELFICEPSEYIYTGRIYSNIYIENILKKFNIVYERDLDIINKTAQYIANGKIVGFFYGRSEFGQRALGNRSILGDPRFVNTKNRLNRAIKYREDFRPFAPAVLEEYCDDIFEDYVETLYMERVLRVKNKWSDKIPAVMHKDGTARLQTVSPHVNKNFYSLIKQFYSITGVPVLLNTSFNLNGEPNVEKPEDAIKTFYSSGLDILVLQEYIIKK